MKTKPIPLPEVREVTHDEFQKLVNIYKTAVQRGAPAVIVPSGAVIDIAYLESIIEEMAPMFEAAAGAVH